MDDKEHIKIKVNKKVVYLIVFTTIIVFLLSFLIFKYFPEQKRTSDINSYKKQIFDSISCQYGCPLTEQKLQNKTQLLPDQSCVQKCTIDLKSNKNESDKFSDQDLKNDDLFLDVENLVTSCKNSSIDQSLILPSINNTLFFNCVTQDLNNFKIKYPYL